MILESTLELLLLKITNTSHNLWMSPSNQVSPDFKIKLQKLTFLPIYCVVSGMLFKQCRLFRPAAMRREAGRVEETADVLLLRRRHVQPRLHLGTSALYGPHS